MPFPIQRPRRLRRTEALRGLVRETALSARSLVYPLFVCPGTNVKEEIRSMPGHFRWSADIVAPSDMMDGRVARIRRELDAHGFNGTPILAYAAKYASGFYGPFREAAGSAPQFGDRKAYQMDPANQREALREIALDIEEGADVIMVKPALPFLDVLALARREFDIP